MLITILFFKWRNYNDTVAWFHRQTISALSCYLQFLNIFDTNYHKFACIFFQLPVKGASDLWIVSTTLLFINLSNITIALVASLSSSLRSRQGDRGAQQGEVTGTLSHRMAKPDWNPWHSASPPLSRGELTPRLQGWVSVRLKFNRKLKLVFSALSSLSCAESKHLHSTSRERMLAN